MKYEEYRATCLPCRKCHAAGLCYPDSFPMFMKQAPIRTDILFVLEAPNKTDTVDSAKQHITIAPDTDKTGTSFWRLFVECLGLDPVEYLFVTNSVLCLPREQIRLNADGSISTTYPVMGRQRRSCAPLLHTLIDEFRPKIVCPVGGEALKAVALIESHPLARLSGNVGKGIRWYGRVLYPLYHTGGRARAARSFDLQKQDWRALKALYESLNQ